LTVNASRHACVAAGFLAAMCAALTTLSAQSGPDADVPRLQPGDRVLITVWRKPELSGESVVTADSVLSHPLYQSLKVVGIPLPVVKERLVAFLAQYERDPLLTIEPLFRVTVGGEVRLPNVYSLARSSTIAQAVAGAGGPTERGKLTKVRLYRAGKEIHLDLNDPRSDQANMAIRSGDNIVVGRSHNFFRDVLAPAASLTAAIVSIVVVARQ
jgi:polysaccharide export outer membrane protein